MHRTPDWQNGGQEKPKKEQNYKIKLNWKLKLNF